MAFKTDRFKTIYNQGTHVEILVDRMTGINYMFVKGIYQGGLTVLLDKDGKPVVSPEYIVNIDDLPEGKA